MTTRQQRLKQGRNILKQTNPERIYSLKNIGLYDYLGINYTYWLLNLLKPFECIKKDEYDNYWLDILTDNNKLTSQQKKKIETAISKNSTSEHKVIWDVEEVIDLLFYYLYCQEISDKFINPTNYNIPDRFQLICIKHEQLKEQKITINDFLNWFSETADYLLDTTNILDNPIKPGEAYFPEGVRSDLKKKLSFTVRTLKKAAQEPVNKDVTSLIKDDEISEITMFLNTQMGNHFQEEDLEALLRDTKLLFRAEHLNLINRELLPWEVLFEYLGSAFEIAFKQFNFIIKDINSDDLKIKPELFLKDPIFWQKVAIYSLSTAAAIGVTAATGGLAVITLATVVTVASTTKKIKTFLLHGAKKVGLLQKKKVDFSQSELNRLSGVKNTAEFRLLLIDKISELWQQAVDVVDITPDIDLGLILDYVYYQTLRGLKVGLKTTYDENQGNPEALGTQQDIYPMHNEKRKLEKNNLVRKARNMLEKAFEYRFENLLNGLRMIPELRDYTSPLGYNSLMRRFELQLWEGWLRVFHEQAIAAGKAKKTIKEPVNFTKAVERIKSVAKEEFDLLTFKGKDITIANQTTQLYKVWLSAHTDEYLQWDKLIQPENRYFESDPFNKENSSEQKDNIYKDKDFLFLLDQQMLTTTEKS
ncbi:MAG: hypothetical protein F6K36_24610 [Symploca sp. SIO3C6]|nr:hypothetical protein [Symploca sp. SIO3C6]